MHIYIRKESSSAKSGSTYVDRRMDQKYPWLRRDNKMVYTVRNSVRGYCVDSRRTLHRTHDQIFRRRSRRSGRKSYDYYSYTVYRHSSVCQLRVSTVNHCRNPRIARNWDLWCCAYTRIYHAPYFPHRLHRVMVNIWRRVRNTSKSHVLPCREWRNNISHVSPHGGPANRRLVCEVSSCWFLNSLSSIDSALPSSMDYQCPRFAVTLWNIY